LYFTDISTSKKKKHSTDVKLSGVALVKESQVENGGGEGTFIAPARLSDLITVTSNQHTQKYNIQPIKVRLGVSSQWQRVYSN
jgi:hypothetical protein